MELLQRVPPVGTCAWAVLASILLELGRREEALEAACEAFAILESVGAEEGESLIRLVHAEALRAAGRDAEARAALASAQGVLLARADKLPDPAMRQRFLQIPENARTLELARELLG